jgi:hypothetical protein
MSLNATSKYFYFFLLSLLGILYSPEAIAQTDIAITNIYSLGKLPLNFGAPHVVTARVINQGSVTVTNYNVTLDITGANTFNDVQMVTLSPGGAALISFTGFTPAATGSEVLTVSVAPDANTSNDSKSWTQEVTANLYGYKDPTLVNMPGGVGFNGGTGQFVAKYNTSIAAQINEIKVDFATSNQPYQVGIWDATGIGGAPGTNLWTSGSLVNAVGTAFIPVSPALSIPAGDFYVGVLQTGLTNVGFAYQTESPLRSNVFYYTSLGGSVWTEFSSAALTFRLSIEAQMFVAQPPNCTISMTPADLNTTACPFGDLSWASGGGGPTSYNVYFGDTYPPPMVTNVTTTSYSPGTLNPGTTYYWYIEPLNASGAATGCDTLEFIPGSIGACYCIPTTTSGCISGDHITSVNVAGLTNASGPCLTASYSDYTSTVAAATMFQGSSYPIEVHVGNGGSEFAGAWIDYDQNGSFDASEFIDLNTPTNAGIPDWQFNATVSVPAGALPGTTRMRVRSSYNAATIATSACANYSFGETEDYLVDIVVPVPCGGTPVAGTASAPAGICAGSNVNLNLTGATAATGIEIQWYEALAGTGGWNLISGATTSNWTVVGQTVDMDYQAIVTCTNGGGTDVSNTVNVVMNTFLTCYCSPLNGTTLHTVINDYMTNATITGTTLNSSNGTDPATGYIQVSPGILSNTAELAQQVGYSFIGTLDPSLGAPITAGIWVDFDQNGVFDAVEYTSLLINGTNPLTGTINVPATALLGQTGMRVRIRAGLFAAPDACLTFGSGETEDYVVTIVAPPACLPPTGLLASNLTGTSADVSWTAVAGATGYEYEVSTSITPPASGTVTTNISEPVSGLNGTTTYYLHVRTDCGSGTFSSWSTLSFITPLQNDDASGAIPITVGNTCVGSAYSNTGATQSVGEPAPSCANSAVGYQTVWYSFVAPPSGAVKISNDFAGGTMGADTRLGLFSAANPALYATFVLLACDDDNGANVIGRSIIYATGLTPGTTYYIEVDGFGTGTIGTFCMDVKELDNTMLASAGSCAVGKTISNTVGYSGWRSLVDNGGNLIANLKDLNSLSGTFNVNVTVNTGAIRTDANGIFYLDRNYKINKTAGTGTSFDVQFFFTDAELAALQAADPNASLGILSVTRQAGATCQANFNAANGVNSFYNQLGNGTSNGANWIGTITPGFSNFYLSGYIFPLNIELKTINAVNVGKQNRVDWTTGAEQKGDYFEVERSADAHNFTKVGEVNAKGEASSYSFWDQTPVAGINYYRLKLMTASGSYSYSQLVNATVKESNTFSVEAYPNPLVDGRALTVTAYGPQGANATVSICDVTGKVLRMVEMSGASVDINMSSFAQGMYLIKYSDSNHSQTIKVNRR